jgi:hypothetical protein
MRCALPSDDHGVWLGGIGIGLGVLEVGEGVLGCWGGVLDDRESVSPDKNYIFLRVVRGKGGARCWMIINGVRICDRSWDHQCHSSTMLFFYSKSQGAYLGGRSSPVLRGNLRNRSARKTMEGRVSAELAGNTCAGVREMDRDAAGTCGCWLRENCWLWGG